MQFLNRKNKYLDDGTGKKPQQRQNSINSSSSNNDDDESSTTGKTIIDIPSPTKIPPFKLKTYPQAWFALLLLVLLRTAVSVFQFTFSVVPTFTSEYFGVTLSAVNWLANIQCIIYVIMSFFTGFIFEKLGVKRSIMASGFLCALGCAIRSIAAKTNPPSYLLTMAGQIVGGSAAPMALNIMTMFTSHWFTENLRATAGMFVASNYGAILVMFVIPSLAKDSTYIPIVVNLVTGFAACVFLPLLFMPEKPPTPPMGVQEHDRPPFFDGLKMLFKNLNFWILFLIQSFNVGLSVAFCALFAQIVGPHGYSNFEAGQLNAMAFFAGTLGCSISGPVLDYTKQHRLFLKLIAPMIFISDIAFIFMVRKDSYASVLFVMLFNQFFLSFLVPVVIELGAETSYPVAEATTNSILWQGAQLFGFIFVLIMDAIRSGPEANPPSNMTNALVFQAAVAGIMMVLSFIFRGRMARSEAAAWEQRTLQRLNELSDKDKENAHLSTSTYPLSSVLGVSLVDPPNPSTNGNGAGNEQGGIIIIKDKHRSSSVSRSES